MHVTVTFRHMPSSDALKSYAEEKSERLERYLLEPAEVHWVLSVEKIRHIADATVSANGVTLKAQDSMQDMYSAIDTVIDKLHKQVKKHKEKVKDRKGHGAAPAGSDYESLPEEALSTAPRIVHRDNQLAKPMSVEEAIMQMDAVGREFLVFSDSSTGKINIIYRMKSGDYGLIEAQQG